MRSFVALQAEQHFYHLTKTSTISFFWSHFGRGVASPSFSALVVSFYVSFYASRFGLHPNSGNRQDQITLSSVSDKQLI